jgi:hypothetical protein
MPSLQGAEEYPSSWACVVTNTGIDEGYSMLWDNHHGYSGTPEHNAWRALKDRCLNSNSPDFKNYGGRGISVCPQWMHSFENFYADMGARPSAKHTLDRIDNNKDYSPRNCRWATRAVQMNNTRKNVFVEINGKKRTIAEWSKMYGKDSVLVRNRICILKWCAICALTIEVRKGTCKHRHEVTS